MTLGEKLRSARQKKGLSQTHVAGEHMTRNMLSQLENDLASPSVKTLLYLAQVLDVSVGWLLNEASDADSAEITKQIKELYRNGKYLDCVELLSHTEQNPDDEQMLLLFRCALLCSERFLNEGNVSAATSMLEIADHCGGLYIGASECRELLTMKLRCTLAAGQTDDLLLQAVREATNEDAIKALTAQHDLLKGKTLVEKGLFDDALPYLHRAESAAVPESAGQRRIYRLLERCYKEREDYKMAYHYACLRSAVD